MPPIKVIQLGTAGRATGLQACTPPSCSGDIAMQEGASSSQKVLGHSSLQAGHGRSARGWLTLAVLGAHITAARKLLRKAHLSEGQSRTLPGQPL